MPITENLRSFKKSWQQVQEHFPGINAVDRQTVTGPASVVLSKQSSDSVKYDIQVIKNSSCTFALLKLGHKIYIRKYE